MESILQHEMGCQRVWEDTWSTNSKEKVAGSGLPGLQQRELRQKENTLHQVIHF